MKLDIHALGDDRAHHRDLGSAAEETSKLAHGGLHAVALAVDAERVAVGVQLEEVVHALVSRVFVGAVDLETGLFFSGGNDFAEYSFELGTLSFGGGQLGNQ